MKRREFFQAAAAFAAAVPASAYADAVSSGGRKTPVDEVGAFTAGEPAYQCKYSDRRNRPSSDTHCIPYPPNYIKSVYDSNGRQSIAR